jgi:hypothetical protein
MAPNLLLLPPWEGVSMKPHRALAISNLKELIATRENEQKRLTAIISFTQNPERRAQALGDLQTLRAALKVDIELLERFEDEES